jgi:peptidoglycan/LPS O-acetylase OafA/YrhL
MQNFNAGLHGLRGAAALIVVNHHLLLTLPWFADRVGLGMLGPKGSFEFSIHRIVEYSPIHIFFGGTEAVVLFFVLSGYLLLNSLSNHSTTDFVLRRMLRLYIPIFASVIFAAILLIVQEREEIIGASWWLNSHAVSISASSLLRNLWVLDGTDFLNSSLWSMKYEVVFSLLVLLFSGYKFKDSIFVFLLCVFVLIAILFLGSNLGLDLLSWLPVFFAGSALILLPERLFFRAIPKFLAGWLIMFLPWYFAGFGFQLNPGIARISMTIGAIFIVDAVRESNTSLARIFMFKPLQIAGKYSYSLYLIHAPVLVFIWYEMGLPEDKEGWLLRVFVSVCTISLATRLVYNIAEGPTLKWLRYKS